MGHALALWLSGPANFVTIQFFVLVWRHKDFKAACERWKGKGVPFKEAMLILHAFQLPMAVLDVLLLKDRVALLALTPSPTWLAVLFIVFIAYYLSIVFMNFKLKGVFPYGIMRDCGTSRKKWARLVGVQIGVLVVLFLP